ncbi:MAG: YihA family ribosome biogenesis GTP-binding protein [Oscillospiraceae bacterium]|nr:YihA family ribosome biogenesis GTP-binding protein [Oscillospiraceae bacterium]
MAVNFNRVEFILSATTPNAFVRDDLPQLAFAGRSNVGKSSVINSIVNRKNFARVGASPGKTTQINYFKIDGAAYLVDLPGYGYAKVSKAERDRWGKLMENYFASGLITWGVMIVDARHKPTADDVTMAQWFFDSGCPLIVVANKLDKLKKSEIEKNLTCIYETLDLREEDYLIPYSAEKNTGRLDLLELLNAVIEGTIDQLEVDGE